MDALYGTLLVSSFIIGIYIDSVGVFKKRVATYAWWTVSTVLVLSGVGLFLGYLLGSQTLGKLLGDLMVSSMLGLVGGCLAHMHYEDRIPQQLDV